jgi:hypothetical protein
VEVPLKSETGKTERKTASRPLSHADLVVHPVEENAQMNLIELSTSVEL